MTADSWNPEQYARFQQERAQPFYDLLGLLKNGAARPRVIDLGCGPGDLTRVLHERLAAGETLGIDSSARMLERAGAQSLPGLRFDRCDIDGEWGTGWDVIFSNAALHWLPNHEELFARLASRLAAHGQLAVQVPANFDHPSHRLAHEVAAAPEFAAALSGYIREPSVLSPEDYAALLYRLGFAEQHVRLQVYGHVLPDTAAVAEWTKGTLLTDYQRRMPDTVFARYVSEYQRRLLTELGDQRPYFYPFKRILLWAQR